MDCIGTPKQRPIRHKIPVQDSDALVSAPISPDRKMTPGHIAMDIHRYTTSTESPPPPQAANNPTLISLIIAMCAPKSKPELQSAQTSYGHKATKNPTNLNA